MDNLEFLSRHYGILMRVHCKRRVTTSLQPLLQKDEKLFQLPGSELVIVLLGPETAERLQHMVDQLIAEKFTGTTRGWISSLAHPGEWSETARTCTIRWAN
ncbi:diguanylate cyclase/phosphodiesterase [Enterobacter cloacae]|uniref:Diguanylate cyclase/phosphodiesterase n=1 Tax=Enterobacter cloacae TaxID=550 RepID=A0A377LVQ2_ENTCL|nr:diguanylate cyclase/phosphodiesterase [Enterobacter cloacae]